MNRNGTSLGCDGLGDQTGENDTYAFGLAAHPGQSQGRPAMSTGLQPKEQIAACPICVLPRKPQASGTSDLKLAAGHDREGASAPRILIPVCQADRGWVVVGVVEEVV